MLGGLAGGVAAAGPLLAGAGTASAAVGAPAAPSVTWASTVAEIERIIRAKGTVSNGVLNIEIDRTDVPNVRKEGVPIKPGNSARYVRSTARSRAARTCRGEATAHAAGTCAATMSGLKL